MSGSFGSQHDENQCDELLAAMVESVGIKAFAAGLGVSTRQVHRMLNGSQANPLRRFCDVLLSCDQKTAEAALSSICRSMGVYWIRVPESVEAAHLNAVKESAEAIVAITEQRSPRVTVREIREAIAALSALERILDRGDALSLEALARASMGVYRRPAPAKT